MFRLVWRGEEEEGEEDWEATGLDECGHPFAVSTFGKIESSQERCDCLGGEDKEGVDRHPEPPLVIFFIKKWWWLKVVVYDCCIFRRVLFPDFLLDWQNKYTSNYVNIIMIIRMR